MPKQIETNFLDRQAKENSKEGTARGIMLGIGLLVVVGAAFGGYQIYSFFANFETNQYLRNVAIILKSTHLKDGKALVTVDVHNSNVFDIQNPRFTYDIEGVDGKQIAAGEVQVEGIIPAADRRSFREVSLGAVQGKPKNLHTHLVDVTVDTPDNVPKGFAPRFIDAMEMQGEAQLNELDKLAKEAPNLASVPTAKGIALESAEQWGNAIAAYQQAITASDKYTNAHYRLGLALLHEKKTDEGMKELERASQLSPNDKAIKEALSGMVTPVDASPQAEEE